MRKTNFFFFNGLPENKNQNNLVIHAFHFSDDMYFEKIDANSMYVHIQYLCAF